jgi:Tfp pilus assembly protein PilX
MMLKRLLKDEGGVALGLAIIMIVLIGVMGAGLLVFVRNDLEAVVEVNQGQRAIDAADAGIQAGKRHLLTAATADATTNIYDGNTTNGDSPWSPNGGGKNLTFNGVANNVNVKIQYLNPSTTSSQLTDPNYAPELVPAGQTDYPEPKDYFKITSTGTAGQAKRKIEAIYLTEDMGVPKGYFTPGSINVQGSACIDSVSLFALGDVTFGGGGGCTLADGTKSHMKGTDLAYGNWCKPPFNTTARGGAAPCTDPNIGNTNAGAGATGTITGSPSLGTRDFHGSTTNPTNPKFIQKNPPDGSQTSSEISFPFDYALPDHTFLRDIAKSNGTYYEVSDGTASLSSWPAPPAGSDPSSTVVYYKFTSNTSNTLKWDVSGSCTNMADDKYGTLVVENGNFTTQPNKARFVGAVVVRGGEVADATAEGEASDTGKTCLSGFINAQGTIKVAGNVSPMSTEALGKRPGWYGVRLWSWRELYQ